MSRSERLLVVLRHLTHSLSYRLEDASSQTSSAFMPIDERVFFDHLYVSVPELEKKCHDALTFYQRPVLLLGKQGIGKTTLLEKVLRSVAIEQDVTIVRIRCSIDLMDAFSSPDKLKELFRTELRFQSALERQSIFGPLGNLFRCEAQYIQNTRDQALKKLYATLFRAYDEAGGYGRFEMPFEEWAAYSLTNRYDVVQAAVAEFEANMTLATEVDLLALQKGPDHRVLFSVDNVESLLNLNLISEALHLLVRGHQYIGTRGRLIVASRPRSYSVTRANNIEHWPDAGHNLYELIDFSKFINAIIVPDEDPPRPASPAAVPQDFAMVVIASRYWDMLERRLRYLVDTLPHLSISGTAGGVDVSSSDIAVVFQAIRELFVSARACTNVIAALANHSCRSFLIIVINFVEHLLIDRNRLQSFLQLTSHFSSGSSETPGDARHLVDVDLNASLFSDFLYFVGHDNAGIPGLGSVRLKIGETLQKFRSTGAMQHEMLAPFFVMKCLDGCHVARFANQDPVRQADLFLPVEEITKRLEPFGFDGGMVSKVVTQLCTPDSWDQVVLDYAADLEGGVSQDLGPKDEVQLETRGFVLANVLPFTFHYWRGDLAQAKYRVAEGVWEGDLTRVQVIATLHAITAWAELEMTLVAGAARAGRTPDEVLALYGKVTHQRGTWCFLSILRSLTNHLDRLAHHSRPTDAEGEAVQELLRKLVGEKTPVMGQLEESLLAVANRILTSPPPERWQMLRQPEFTWWSDFISGAGK